MDSSPPPPAADPAATPAAPTALTVDARLSGQTLAALVRHLLPGTTWRQARLWISEARVAVDGKPEVDEVRRLKAGQQLVLRDAPGADGTRPNDLVRYLDPDVVVAEKPTGVLTAPFDGDERDTLIHRLRVEVRRRERASRGGQTHERGGKTGWSPALRVVQRLDKETSGLLVIARTTHAERELQGQLADRTLERRYLALVHGVPRAGVYESYLVDNRGDGLRGSWDRLTSRRQRPGKGGSGPPADAKLATTEVEVRAQLLGRVGGEDVQLALVACKLGTGRTHQIRIHLAEAGHPVVGEPVYLRDFRGTLVDAPRLMLHAAELSFLQPRTGERLSFTAPPPPAFGTFLASLRPAAQAAPAAGSRPAPRPSRPVR